jgi:HEAT repeat protein
VTALPGLTPMWLRLGMALATVAIGSVAAAGTAILAVPSDGWVTWSVPTVADAPAWCCFEGYGRRSASAGCDLDDRSGGYGSRDADAPVDRMQVYARMSKGVLQRIRAFGPSCPVESATAVSDLGDVAADDSVRWLQQRIGTDDQITADLLAALSVHAGPVARDALSALARGGTDAETRKDAVFWMGQVRASDSSGILRSILFDDADPAVREHAAFSIAQSSIESRAADLIRSGTADPVADVRAQAWFWLAQTGAPESESAINRALAAESDPDVRERAIFALSQLPDDRAVDALGTVLDDPSRSRDDRKRALFWLGQSDSPRAHDYLARVLDGH